MSGFKPVRVQHLAEVVNGYPFDSERFDTSNGYPLLRIRDVGADATEIRYTGEFVEAARVVRGDVVVGMDGDFKVGQWLGAEDALLNQRVALLRTDAITARFLLYALPQELEAINAVTYATTVKHLSASQILHATVSWPGIEGASVIVDFLDRETAKIDALIAKQDALTAVLREERIARRDALIDAVWEGAERVQLRHAADVTVGIVVTPSAWYAECGVPALRGLNVKDERIDSVDLVHLTEEGHAEHAKSHLLDGDVVVVRTGQAGTAAAVPSGLGPLNAIDLLVARPGPDLDGEYVAMVLNGTRTKSAIASGTVGAIQGHFNVGALRLVELPLPSLHQQECLVREWRATASRIDLMITRGGALRDVLIERRAALITAAVTGALDVTTYRKAG